MVQLVFFRLLLSVFLINIFHCATGQNLFANADFEAVNNCTEYHQDCSSEAWFYIKPSATPLFAPNAVPRPFSGKDLMILPVENIYNPVKKRQFIYTMFCCPLQKGKNYKLSFYIHTGGKTFYGMDFYMRSKEFTSENFVQDSVNASIHISENDITNELEGWNRVETTYTADGTERFCLMGNLSKKPFDFAPYQRMNKAGDIFYFLDDIVFKPVLPEAACESYKINVEKLYSQNLRHTELVLVEKEEKIKTDTIVVPAVFFETDKDILKPAFKKLLDSLLVKFSGRNISGISIDGHTDSKGSEERNIILSKERAEAVAKYFIRKKPDLKNKIVALGKAAKNPIAENTSEKGRAKNRRVEIILSYTMKEL